MARAFITSAGPAEGYIDYGVSHRYFRIASDGTVWGTMGVLTDQGEIALALAAREDIRKPVRRYVDDCSGCQQDRHICLEPIVEVSNGETGVYACGEIVGHGETRCEAHTPTEGE